MIASPRAPMGFPQEGGEPGDLFLPLRAGSPYPYALQQQLLAERAGLKRWLEHCDAVSIFWHIPERFLRFLRFARHRDPSE